VDS
jgi:hypothetical protein